MGALLSNEGMLVRWAKAKRSKREKADCRLTDQTPRPHHSPNLPEIRGTLESVLVDIVGNETRLFTSLSCSLDSLRR